MVGEVWPWSGGYGHSRGGDGHSRGGDVITVMNITREVMDMVEL